MLQEKTILVGSEAPPIHLQRQRSFGWKIDQCFCLISLLWMVGSVGPAVERCLPMLFEGVDVSRAYLIIIGVCYQIMGQFTCGLKQEEHRSVQS